MWMGARPGLVETRGNLRALSLLTQESLPRVDNIRRVALHPTRIRRGAESSSKRSKLSLPEGLDQPKGAKKRPTHLGSGQRRSNFRSSRIWTTGPGATGPRWRATGEIGGSRIRPAFTERAPCSILGSRGMWKVAETSGLTFSGHQALGDSNRKPKQPQVECHRPSLKVLLSVILLANPVNPEPQNPEPPGPRLLIRAPRTLQDQSSEHLSPSNSLEC